MALLDEPCHQREQGVLIEDQSSCLQNGWQALGIFLVAQGPLDALDAFIKVVDVDRDETFRREVVCGVRATMIERKAMAEERIAEFFGPMMAAHVVFNGQMQLVGVECVGLVVAGAHALAEDIEGWQFGFQVAGELEAGVMEGVAHLFVRADGGDGQGLGRRGLVSQDIIGAAGTAAAVEPDVAGLG